MLALFRKWFLAPTFEDRSLTNQARSLHAILVFIFALTLLYLPYAIFFPPREQTFIVLSALIIETSLWFLMRSGRIRLAGILLVIMIWTAILWEEIVYGGVKDSGFASFSIVIVIASLTIGFTGGAVITVLSIIAGIGLIIAENLMLLGPFHVASSDSVLISHSITFVAILLLLYLAIRSLTASSQKIMDDEKVTREINLELEKKHSELMERTNLLERRNKTLETITDLGHLFNTIREENEYLKRVVELLSRRLGYSRISIYLFDDTNENAILRASNGDMPIRILQVTHSMTGYGYRSGETIGLQSGDETYSITLPGLIDGMLSTVNLPIKTGSKLFGLLNIQSVDVRLSAEDISVLEISVDQIANGLENIRTFEQLQRRLSEIEQLVGQTTQSGWKKVEAGTPFGFEYDRIQIMPGNEEYPPEVVNQLLQKKSISYVTKGVYRTSRLVAPIILRNQVLGMIGYEENDPGHTWEQDNIIVLETIAAQVSLALENTRLIAEAQERARHEKLIANVTSRMRETLDIDIILQTAIREIRDAFALKKAEIRLQALPEETIEE